MLSLTNGEPPQEMAQRLRGMEEVQAGEASFHAGKRLFKKRGIPDTRAKSQNRGTQAGKTGAFRHGNQRGG